ncbi:sugar ABC transporter substrate-binding protein [Brachybacterium endophyticum]|uniref:Sugar ABC transporter substrate-binding protein n=1 Tax=Brachybacterium endophyticum TaxID=2182385 RepID=A0A2U2RHR2_9MICO|nr:extracellular solute-binding protein [Brachybacterium endophyticum]PWH05386.1 sugar ABC transporter substrate-binding protein [Brachybacterium endophyticum]
MTSPTRRALLRAAGVTGLLTAPLAACGTSPTISEDPDELVLWYWDRSASPELLTKAARSIPGTASHVRADAIGTTFDTKLRTSLAGGAYIPDITYINSNNALYFRNENQFLDMNELGAKEYASDYYPWKWDLGTTPENRFCFFPLDIGPTGFFYRQDVFEQAGLPTSPDEVSEAVRTWKDWIDLGAELRKATGSALVTTAQSIYEQFLNASAERYLDEQDAPLYTKDGSAVREAWDTAMAAISAKVTAGIPEARKTDQNAGWSSGKIAGSVNAAWWSQVLQESAPDSEGLWRIADQPVRPGNSGGSFAAIPHTCKDPEGAFAFIRWINTPAHQAEAYNDVQLFPSAPDSYASDTMKYGGRFFGDQDPLEFFSRAAEHVPTSFISTWESVISGYFTLEITNVETAGKDPDRAWADATAAAEKALRKRGVLS